MWNLEVEDHSGGLWCWSLIFPLRRQEAGLIFDRCYPYLCITAETLWNRMDYDIFIQVLGFAPVCPYTTRSRPVWIWHTDDYWKQSSIWGLYEALFFITLYKLLAFRYNPTLALLMFRPLSIASTCNKSCVSLSLHNFFFARMTSSNFQFVNKWNLSGKAHWLFSQCAQSHTPSKQILISAY